MLAYFYWKGITGAVESVAVVKTASQKVGRKHQEWNGKDGVVGAGNEELS